MALLQLEGLHDGPTILCQESAVRSCLAQVAVPLLPTLGVLLGTDRSQASDITNPVVLLAAMNNSSRCQGNTGATCVRFALTEGCRPWG